MSVAFYAFLVAATRPVAADDAADAQWVPLSTLARARVAFDHPRIIALAVDRLRAELAMQAQDGVTRARFEIVPARFTLSELQHVHEAVLGKQLDKRNFRSEAPRRRTSSSPSLRRIERAAIGPRSSIGGSSSLFPRRRLPRKRSPRANGRGNR